MKKKQPEIIINKVFTKDVSFESFNTPDIFKKDWKSSLNFNIDISSKKIAEDRFEAELTSTFTAKDGEENVYIAEITQTGIFNLVGIEGEQLEHILNVYCPNTLMPYIKTTLDATLTRCGFNVVNLAPINFDAINMQKKAKQQQEVNSTSH